MMFIPYDVFILYIDAYTSNRLTDLAKLTIILYLYNAFLITILLLGFIINQASIHNRRLFLVFVNETFLCDSNIHFYAPVTIVRGH